MADTLDRRSIRLFDHAAQFAQPFREAIRAHAERVAAEEGIEVAYIKAPKGFPQGGPYPRDRRCARRSSATGPHFSVMERCSSDRPWHDKRTGMTYLLGEGGKCVYYYFIDEVLGLCFLSVPTWCPFRGQFYLNGHNCLASKLRRARLSFELRDNAEEPRDVAAVVGPGVFCNLLSGEWRTDSNPVGHARKRKACQRITVPQRDRAREAELIQVAYDE